MFTTLSQALVRKSEIEAERKEAEARLREVEAWLTSPEATETLFAERGLETRRVVCDSDVLRDHQSHRLFWTVRWEGEWWAVDRGGVLTCLCCPSEEEQDAVRQALRKVVGEEPAHLSVCGASQKADLVRTGAIFDDYGALRLPGALRLYHHMGWKHPLAC